MEDLALSETEARYFGDLFLCCDEEADGRAPLLKATELFRSSNISNEALKQIMEISVPGGTSANVSHMNRKQFYSALKLIAAHQAGIPLKPDLLSTQLDLPLPRFTWTLNAGSENNADLIQLSNSPKEQHVGKRERAAGGVGGYVPMRLSQLSDSEATTHRDNTEPLSTDSEIESETVSRDHSMRTKSGSPWSTASDSPTPTNSVAERRPHPVWENSATGRGVWPASTAEEHTQLLGTEEESSDRHSSDEEGGGGGGGEAGGGVWTVTPAQARHYSTQYSHLQAAPHGLVPAHAARLFFEKSRLPVSDLRKIWHLATVTSDGALSLEEFSVAMHLIVLRRNGVAVPDQLPQSLLQDVRSRFSQQAVSTDLVDLGSDMFSSGTSADFNLAPKESSADPYEAKPKKEDRRTSLSPKTDQQTNNKEWTKFVDSPTSSLSSPGPKPVNFDFKPVKSERDKIYHPVALRVTPDANTLDESRSSVSPHGFEIASPKRLSSAPPVDIPPNGTAEIKPLQRPQAKKPLKPAGTLPPPPAREPSVHADDGPQSLQYAPKKEAPPPPPPRPVRSHARSSSLDLNRLPSHPAPAPPPPHHPPPSSPPRLRRLSAHRADVDTLVHRSNAEEFANFDNFEGGGLVRNPSGERHGAFEVYRKPQSREASCELEPDVKSLREQNSLLQRVCRALCGELADAQREREALRMRLEGGSGG